MKGQSGTTVGVFAVLAILVTVAVVGAMFAGTRQQRPPLEVVVDMPPPAPEPVAEQTPEPAPESVADGETPIAPDQMLAESREDAPRPPDPSAENVQEIDTAAGSDTVDEAPPPSPVAETVDAGTEDREIAAAPAMEEPRPSVRSTFDYPTPLFDAVVISRRSNLRSEPGPDSPVLAKLDPGERVYRLDDKPVLGYYRVSAEGVVGWIWWLNVSDGPGGNVEG